MRPLTVAACACTCAVVAVAPPQAAPPLDPGGRLVVATERVGTRSRNYDVVVMNADGSGTRVLLGTSGDERSPDPSPDGRWIAFECDFRCGDGAAVVGVGVVRTDGSGRRSLAPGSLLSGKRHWSADSRQLLVTDGDSPGIFAVRTDGHGRRRVTRGLDDVPLGWSSDGRRVLFRRGEALVVVRLGGGGIDVVVRARGAGDAAWSPDGREILFTRYDGAHSGLYVRRPDGKTTRLAKGRLSLSSNPWSPDGRRVAFAFDSGGAFVVARDGSGRVRVDRDAGTPAWSPDGRFLAMPTSEAAVYVARPMRNGIVNTLIAPVRHEVYDVVWMRAG